MPIYCNASPAIVKYVLYVEQNQSNCDALYIVVSIFRMHAKGENWRAFSKQCCIFYIHFGAFLGLYPW